VSSYPTQPHDRTESGRGPRRVVQAAIGEHVVSEVMAGEHVVSEVMAVSPLVRGRKRPVDRPATLAGGKLRDSNKRSAPEVRGRASPADSRPLRKVLDEAPVMITSFDLDGRLRFGNRQFAAALGIDRERLVGKTRASFLPHAQDAAAHRANDLEVLSSAKPLHFEEEVHFPDGVRTYASIKFPLRAGDGRVCGLCAVSTEITDRRPEESERRRLASIVTASHDAVVSLDADLRIASWNNGAQAIYGYAPDEVLGRSSDILIPPDATPESRGLRQQLLAGGEVDRYETQRLHKDGSLIEVAITAFALFDAATNAYSAITITRDIGKRKAREAELRSSESFVAAITDSMAEGMYAIDGTGAVTYMNRAAERMLGWTEGELRGRSIHEAIHFVRLDGSSYPIDECPLLGVRTTGEPVTVASDVFVCRSGQLLPVAYTSSPHESGGDRGAVVVFRDITETKAEEARLAREMESSTWVGRIREALDEERFVLYAQPIVELSSGRVTQHELLIRMVDRSGKLIQPNLFLPTAERYGLIEEIDQWVIGEAARLVGEGQTVAVQFNLSGKSMAQTDLAARIRSALHEHGGDPECLICEITETALLEQDKLAEAFVRELTALGCKVALDDFGTGYGGFTYLKRLPVAYLKIDIEFVRDLADNPASRHVVAAIVSLANGFGQKTIAEGVEDERTLKLLKAMGVDYAQGHGIARPAPVRDVLKPVKRSATSQRVGPLTSTIASGRSSTIRKRIWRL
jgi:PAS domain S-box-containing protein